jgi:hypothetical protein
MVPRSCSESVRRVSHGCMRSKGIAATMLYYTSITCTYVDVEEDMYARTTDGRAVALPNCFRGRIYRRKEFSSLVSSWRHVRGELYSTSRASDLMSSKLSDHGFTW